MTHQVVDGAYLLCAVGGSSWEWTGPGGFTAQTICVMANTPGTYTVRVFDGFIGVWSDPCSFSFTSIPTSPVCAITGVDSACVGASTSWCAPGGNYTYSWTGPGGFTASAQCVDVSAAGDYQLSLTDNATGMASTPCTRTLVVSSCAPPPPPPPPPPSLGVCPSPAKWWGRSCNDQRPPLDPTTFAHIAALVDDRSAAWSYGGTADGLCALLRRGHMGYDMATAKRHYAAVLANLAAAELGVKAPDGHAVGLDPSASLSGLRELPSGGTVGDWVAATEIRMVAIATTSSRSRSMRDDCRRIARQARAINRMPGTCVLNRGALADDDDDDDDLGTGDASMTSGASATLSSTTRPDPLTGGGRTSWTLLRTESVELRIIDITGRSVRHLARGMYSAGVHDFTWDGRDDDGRAVRTGAYFVAGRVGSERLSQRLFILR
jgi:hypothetical protein